MIKFISTSSQYLTSSATITPPTSGTICFWYLPTTITGTQSLLFQDSTFRIVLGWTTAGEIQTYLYRKFNKPTSTVSSGITAGTLYHITCTWNNSSPSTNTIYINAVQNVSNTNTLDTPGAASLYVSYDSGPNYLNAQLEDIRMYNRILSLEEIQTIYQSQGVDSIIDGLIQRWDFVSGGAPASNVTTEYSLVSAGVNLSPTNNPTYQSGILRKRSYT